MRTTQSKSFATEDTEVTEKLKGRGLCVLCVRCGKKGFPSNLNSHNYFNI